jgi:hypothetical protein
MTPLEEELLVEELAVAADAKEEAKNKKKRRRIVNQLKRRNNTVKPSMLPRGSFLLNRLTRYRPMVRRAQKGELRMLAMNDHRNRR